MPAEYDRPFRLRVLDALTECLETITPANGYKYDLTGRVYRGRLVYGEETDIPFLSILEPPLPIDQIYAPDYETTSSGEWDLLIQGFVQDDKEHPTDPGHFLLADVKKRLAMEIKRNLGPPKMIPNILGMTTRIERLHIGAGVVRPPDEISEVTNFWLNITIKIVEDNEKPYGEETI